MNIDDITITSLETIDAFDIVTGSYLFTLDELQSATIAQSQEKTDITGKQGRKLSSLKKNKAVTISGNNGLVSGGLLEMQTGGKFENKVTEVMWTDYLIVSENAVNTTYKAVGTTGNEVEAVYIKNTDGTLGKTLTQDAATSEGKFTYDPATKELKFAEDEIADGTEIVVYYKRKIQASVPMCTAYSSTVPRLTSTVSSLSRWATTRLFTLLKRNLWLVPVAVTTIRAVSSSHTPFSVPTLMMWRTK